MLHWVCRWRASLTIFRSPNWHRKTHITRNGQISINQQQQTSACFVLGAAHGPAKRWPVHYFIQLAECKIRQGWQIWCFGSPKDVAVNRALCDALAGDAVVNFSGQLQLMKPYFTFSSDGSDL